MDNSVELYLDELKIHPAADLVPRMRPDEWKAFLEDVKKNGVLEPVVVDGFTLLDGRHRLDASRESGFDRIAIREVNLSPKEQIEYIIRSSVLRRHLSDDQRAILAARLREPLSKEAKRERASKGGRSNGGNLLPHVGNKSKTNTLIEAARDLNVSKKKVEKAVELQRKSPDLADKVLAGDLKLKDAERSVRRSERVKRIAEVSKNNAKPLARKSYPVLLCDPPWKYDFIEVDAWKVENHYPTMATAEICELSVAPLATPDAILFLWATAPKLADAISVISAWGFTYKTCAIWDKEWTGMGNYFRIQHELLLIATRGSIPPPITDARPASIIREKRSTKHSEKPQSVYAIIEAMYPEFPKVELFARAPRKGWATWGNEVESNL